MTTWIDSEDVSQALMDAKFELRVEDCWSPKFAQVAELLNQKVKAEVKGKMEKFIREL